MITIIPIQSYEYVDKTIRFLQSSYSFDDKNPTKGEIEHFQTYPLLAFQKKIHVWIAITPKYEVVGFISVKENEHQTGGYTFDYIVVHKNYRSKGIAKKLLETIYHFVRNKNGRYILTYTCDLPIYERIQRLFKDFGFVKVGFIPDFYYEGEGMILFYKKVVGSFSDDGN